MFLLLVLCVASLASASSALAAQSPAKPPTRQASASAPPSPALAELRTRLDKLTSAKQSNDPAAVVDAARHVIASAMRQMGELNRTEGRADQAIEIYRKSIGFEDTPEAHVDLAAAYLAAGQLGECISETANTILASPDNARAWHLHGKVLIAKQDYRHAADALQQSVSLQANANASYLLGMSLLQLNEYDKASAVFADLSAQGKDRAGLHLLFADAYRKAGFHDDASRELAEALRLAPAAKKFPAWFADSDPAASFDADIPLHPTVQQRQRAKTRTMELSTIVASALNDLGASEARQQKFDLAFAHFHEAERWRANTPGLMRNIGLAAVRVSDYGEAARALRSVVAVHPEDQVARSLLATALFSTGNCLEADRAFTPLGDSVLGEPELAYSWATCLVRISQFSRAAALLEKLEKQNLPAETLVLVAQTWSQMGNYPRTVEDCHRALQLDPKSAQAHYIAGMAQIRADHPAEAASEFRDQLALDPDNLDAAYYLAFVLLQQSHSDEAVTLLHTVLARNPDHPQANYELGRVLLGDGQKEEAIGYLEAAARLNPQLDAVHYQLQSAYRSLGRKADADRELKIDREMKAKNRNVNLSPMGEQPAQDQKSTVKTH